MNSKLIAKLRDLQLDFKEVQGRPFNHFFCPVLYSDDNVSLCKAHLINKAFHDTPRTWTVQRADIDHFYGSHFESDFLLIQDRHEHSIDEILVDRVLSKRFNAQILIDNEPVDHFIAPAVFPETFTRLDIDMGDRAIHFGLKLNQEDAKTAITKQWQISISKDLRVPALVSVIKVAHLTLFEILGYRYAFSPSGRFIGRQILGEFFIQNNGKSRSEVFDRAIPFFRNYAHMMRPLMSSEQDYQGTITDGKVLFCGRDQQIWAIIIFIKISRDLHCVLIPTLANALSIYAFADFMNSTDEMLQVTSGKYDRVERRWLQGNTRTELIWPKAGVIYP